MDINHLSILLATYNSSQYLEEQINSLINQVDKRWKLFIRDDGSKDDTIEIIKKYTLKYDNIFFLQDNLTGLGPMKSFMKLLSETDSDYYMFCDHDDVWLPEKIRTIKNKMVEMEELYNDKPIIIHSDLKVVNNKLKTIHESFWKSSGIKPNVLTNKYFIQVFNCVTGCTMMFNKKVKEYVFPYPSNAPMHDWWLAIMTLKNNGIVKGISSPTILYRQHTFNEVGARNVDTKYFYRKIRNLKNTLYEQKKQIIFLKEINGLNAFGYYFIKVLYSLIRKL